MILYQCSTEPAACNSSQRSGLDTVDMSGQSTRCVPCFPVTTNCKSLGCEPSDDKDHQIGNPGAHTCGRLLLKTF